MSLIKVQGNASGTGIFTVAAPNSNTDRTLTLPDQTGTVLTNAGPFTANASASAGAVTIDASNNVGIGTSSPVARLNVSVADGGGVVISNTNDTHTGALSFGDTSANSSGRISYDHSSNALRFDSNGSERARIDSSGYWLVNKTSATNYGGIPAQAYVTVTGGQRWLSVFDNAHTTPQGLFVTYTGAAPNGTANEFIYCQDTSNTRFYVRSNGGISNYSANNTNLSDARLKTDFRPAPSYYERWRKIDFVTYLYKDQTDTERNLGVTAQQLETVCPELIDNSGFGKMLEGEAPYKSIYQTDFQYATAVALQEAIAKIEELTAKLDAAEARIAALEAA